MKFLIRPLQKSDDRNKFESGQADLDYFFRRYALKLALHQRDTVGCVGVVVDAKTEAVEFYQKFGFRLIDGIIEGEIRGNPPPKPLFLPINSITIAEI